MSNEIDKEKIKYWASVLNDYGRLRVFLSEEDAKECQRALTQIVALIGAFKEVTEECIAEKAKEWIGKNWDDSWRIAPSWLLRLLEDFANLLIEEIRGNE